MTDLTITVWERRHTVARVEPGSPEFALLHLEGGGRARAATYHFAYARECRANAALVEALGFAPQYAALED